MKLKTRQVHLDFHTSEHVPGVGHLYSKEQFQSALKIGHVNSITVFAKCHHSWSYYPTRFGRMHPGLKFDLLGAQIGACHEIGVAAPVYLTVGWSANDAERLSECVSRDLQGNPCAIQWDFASGPDAPRPECSWKHLCPSGRYLRLILDQTAEICAGYPVDGFFYDINNFVRACYCENCLQGYLEQGISREDLPSVTAYNFRKWAHLREACNGIIKAKHPDATLFYNSQPDLLYHEESQQGNTHCEIEDLPTAWGGYNKTPLHIRQKLKTGLQVVAMSGKFHTSWGEFGGFKHCDAIRYEAAAMVSWGANCSFGDQLHPSGKMDMGTYENLGAAYAYVEKIEEYGIGGRSAANLGLWMVEATESNQQGVVNMLLENQRDFDPVGPGTDLGRYEVIILSGSPCLNDEASRALAAFVKGGGALLILGASALQSGKKALALDIGAEYQGPSRHENDYTLVGSVLRHDIVASPFLNYRAALRVLPRKGTAILAEIKEPYFDRTYARYCSHKNTPFREETAAHPAVIRNGNVVFMAHELGRMYEEWGARIHRQLFINALDLLHHHPVMKVRMPSGGRANLIHQEEHRRYVAHLLYGPPMARGKCLVVEDLVPLYNIPLEIRVPQKIMSVRGIPDEASLPFEQRNGALSLIVPRLECHAAIVFEY